MRYDRIVIGYHGCDAKVADRLLGGEPFRASANRWDWLGDGIYFWEYGADRAFRYAESNRRIRRPAVVGALIHLGRCFDLLDTRFTRDLEAFFPIFQERFPVPVENHGKARYLDRAVLNGYLERVPAPGYDSVRGVFIEGEPVFAGAGIHLESHIQIAVRNPDCIVGTFRPTSLGSDRRVAS